MKKIAGYAVACAVGAMLSGTTVFAATNYVQAKRATTTLAVNGKAVSHPTALSYGGSTYLPVSAVQQALKKAGINSTWKGSTFNIIHSSGSGSTGGGTPNPGGGSSAIGVSKLPYTYKSPSGMQITFNRITADSSGTVINVTLTNNGKADGDAMMSTSYIMVGGTKVPFIAQDQAFYDNFLEFHPGQSVTGDVTYGALPDGTTTFTLYYNLSAGTYWDQQHITFDLTK
jgi:archaellum component FlaF (FlaF/FlaG flagellin family)